MRLTRTCIMLNKFWMSKRFLSSFFIAILKLELVFQIFWNSKIIFGHDRYQVNKKWINNAMIFGKFHNSCFSFSFSTTWRRDKSFIVLGCHNDMLWGQLSCQMRSPLTSNCLDICSLVGKKDSCLWSKLKRAVRSQFSHKWSLLEMKIRYL